MGTPYSITLAINKIKMNSSLKDNIKKTASVAIFTELSSTVFLFYHPSLMASIILTLFLELMYT